MGPVHELGPPKVLVPGATQTLADRCHVLVAEDDDAMRSVVAMALRAAGHRVTERGEGYDLLSLLQDSSAADVLVVDIWMAGIGDTEACAALRAGGLDVAVVFITGEHADDLRRSGAVLPSDTILQKPFRLAELEAAVSQACESHGIHT